MLYIALPYSNIQAVVATASSGLIPAHEGSLSQLYLLAALLPFAAVVGGSKMSSA